MYRETVEELLSKDLERHETLAVGLNRRGRENCVYYYKLSGRDQLLQVRSALQEAAAAAAPVFSGFPGMKHPYYCRPRKDDVDRDLVIRLQEDEVMLTLTFLPITEVEYRKSFQGKIEPFVITGKPVYTLLIQKGSGELYAGGRTSKQDFKICWWFNKLCMRNDTVRRFFVNLFQEMGKTGYIFKDLARTLRDDSYILPPLSYSELLELHTPKDLVRHFSQLDLGIDYNKMDINAAYYLVRLAEQISEKDRGKLREIPPEWILKNIGLRDLYTDVSVGRFVGLYYQEKLGDVRTRVEVARTAADYVALCQETRQEIRIGFNSVARLCREHDQLALLRNMAVNAAEFEKPLVPENSRFSLLKELEWDGFEYITETKRLFEEGVRMHNCVYSYRWKVREDRCAILHWNGMDIGPYTIEISDDGHRFRIEQMQTRFNRGYSIYDRQILDDHLRQINRMRNQQLETEVQNVFGGIVEFVG